MLLLIAACLLVGCGKSAEDGAAKTVQAVTNSIGMRLNLLPGGTFAMGGPVHEVTLSQPFYMGLHEVTQEQYERVMGTNPSEFKGRSNPVEQVSWGEAVVFCRKLSALPEEKLAGRVYRLPTEAEWEYACRAGTTTQYSFGDNASGLSAYAWFSANSAFPRTTHPVGKKGANGWGLYDMHGNVWEWCSDWYGDYPSGAATDPRGPTSGSRRVYRGGGWISSARVCRSAFRYYDTPHPLLSSLGFRLVMIPSGAGELSSINTDVNLQSATIPTQSVPAASGREVGNSTESIVTNSIGVQLKLLPGGTFFMGDVSRAREVRLTEAFHIGTYETTQEQYELVMGNNPSKFRGPNKPVETVSWDEAVEFCRRLTGLPAETAAGRVYRLPTEAEWGYACRAGTTTQYSFGDDKTQLREYAWVAGYAGNSTHPIGEQKPNAWGLYDMHGNVSEWCQDPSGAVTDPTGPTSGSPRVYRGGGWISGAGNCRSWLRAINVPDARSDYLGFRVVLIPSVAGGAR